MTPTRYLNRPKRFRGSPARHAAQRPRSCDDDWFEEQIPGLGAAIPGHGDSEAPPTRWFYIPDPTTPTGWGLWYVEDDDGDNIDGRGPMGFAPKGANL